MKTLAFLLVLFVGAAYGGDPWCPYPLAPNDLDYCRDCGPCSEWEGDCDNDSECEPGLVCKEVKGVDYCVRENSIELECPQYHRLFTITETINDVVSLKGWCAP